MKPQLRRALFTLACIPATVALVNCGGGGGSTAASGGSSTTTLSGSVVKGPCSGTTVRVLNGSTGALLGTATTNASGAYSVDVGFSGDVIIEATGGTCADEATSSNVALGSTMRSVMTLNGGSVTGVVTPLTTMAYSFAFGSGTTGVTASAFNTKATSLASQFQLGSVNIATTTPVVTGTTNNYGQVLRAISQYMKAQNVTLGTLTNSYFTSTADWAAFNTAFNSAWAVANPGVNATYAFNGTGLTVAGTGVGGGTGSCGVHVQGTVTAAGVTVPLNIDYCIQGIAAGSCTSGNTSLSQALSGQSGLAGAVNLNYTYSAACASGAFNITLQ